MQISKEVTHMRRLLGTLLDVGARELRKLRVPHEILGAVKLTPVPVRTHHSTNEVGVVLVRGSVVDEVARLGTERRRRDRGSSRKGNEGGEDLHASLPVQERKSVSGRIVEKGGRLGVVVL
jgi:hypothetical protein